MAGRRWFLAVSILVLVGAADRPALAAVDLTGDWYMHFDMGFDSFTVAVDIAQTGTVLTVTLNSSASTIFTGTIDVDTGALSLTANYCGSPETLTGTAALDSSTFTASGTLSHPLYCIPATTTVAAARGACGDGTLTPQAESCDDGNTTGGDCCSAGCAYEPNGSPCTDGNPSTCETCDGAGTCQSTVCPSFDLSGAWAFNTSFGPICLQFTQNGIGLSAEDCSFSGTASMIGTIDPDTRHFFITQPPDGCDFPGDSYCELDATAAPDFLSWTGTYTCRFFKTTPPVECFIFADAVTAYPEHCGDGYPNPETGEQCDLANNASDDCCLPTCQYVSSGTSCSYSPLQPCGVCNATGACQPMECPFELDHYKCYSGTDLKNPLFVRKTVNTSDQISDGQITAHKLKYVCAPVDKNGEGIRDATAHLACYQVSALSLSPRPQTQVSTQFQMSLFELKRPHLLCLPATKIILP